MTECIFCGMLVEGAAIPIGDRGWVHADSSECRPCRVCGDVVEGTAVITQDGYEHIAHAAADGG
jgi:hypothetical protein